MTYCPPIDADLKIPRWPVRVGQSVAYEAVPLMDAGHPGHNGVVGTMYCTWGNNWDDLERYAEVWWGGRE